MEHKRILVLTSFVASFIIHEGFCQTCDSGWLMYREECFKCFDESVIHSATTKRCASEGARLISTLTPGLKEFLLRQSEHHENSSYWCSTLTEENDHATSQPSTPLPLPSAAATQGTVPKEGNHEGKCCYIQNKAVHEGSCDGLRGFICEKDTVSPPGTCPQGTDKIGESCFWKVPVLLARSTAEDVCAARDGHLANLKSRKKRIYGIAVAILKRKDFWVGARRRGGKVEWGDGGVSDLEADKNFIPIQDDGGDCIRLGLSNVSRSGTTWIIGNCNITAYALCEGVASTPPTMATTTAITTTTPKEFSHKPSCPGSRRQKLEIDGYCFWEASYETDLVDWDTARQYCQIYGGDLVSYKSAREEELTLGVSRGGNKGMWIGLRREPGSKVFRWSDGSSSTYTNWAPGQPKTAGNSKLCVAHRGENAQWETSYCGFQRWFVCKILKATIPASPVLPTVEPIAECSRPGTSRERTGSLFKDYCYVFYHWDEFSWETAKTFCQDHGAFLASVHSVEENNFLIRLSPRISSLNDFWIGLRAKGLQSSYEWDDGTPLDFLNWDEDDDYHDSSNIDTCVSYDALSGFWKKKHCNLLSHVICKARKDSDQVFTTAAPTPSLPGFCPDEWYTFGNKCYKIHGMNEKETWSGANRKCSEIGSKLVSIHSKEETDFLSLLVMNVHSATWIGMYSTIGGRLFHWTDNSTMDYTNWDADEPTFSDGEEECVHIAASNSENVGKWNDHRCDMRFAYICQIPKDPMLNRPGRDPFLCEKPQGWLKLQSSCYKIFNEPDDDRLTWLQAQSFCMSVARNLASVRNFAVSSLLRHHLTGQQGFFWIGMRDTKKHNYAWIEPSPLSYTNWLRGQPQAVSDLYNCVAVNNEGKWVVRDCFESHPFICEEGNESPTVAPHDPNMICPNSSQKWIDFGGKSCYIIELKDRIKWYAAAHRCFQEGGHLASFHSADEMEVVKYHINDSNMPVHIGFGQKEDGSFGWFDGTAVDYVNWAPGEPNDPGEMCVEMHSDAGTWNDIRCIENRGYVCSVAKVPRNVSSTSALEDKEEDLRGRVAAGGIVGIVVCVLVVLVIVVVAAYYFCPSTRMRSRRVSEPPSP